MSSILQTTLTILAILIGAAAIAYFYFSTDIFTDILKRPLKIISVGMLIINLGVILVAFMAYESSQGNDINFFGLPISTCFYALYFLGSFLVIFGSRKFTRLQQPVSVISTPNSH